MSGVVLLLALERACRRNLSSAISRRSCQPRDPRKFFVPGRTAWLILTYALVATVLAAAPCFERQPPWKWVASKRPEGPHCSEPPTCRSGQTVSSRTTRQVDLLGMWTTDLIPIPQTPINPPTPSRLPFYDSNSTTTKSIPPDPPPSHSYLPTPHLTRARDAVSTYLPPSLPPFSILFRNAPSLILPSLSRALPRP